MADIDQRPAKKRRFFVDDSPVKEKPPPPLPKEKSSSKEHGRPRLPVPREASGEDTSTSSRPSSSNLTRETQSSGQSNGQVPAFDDELFQSFVGEKVEPKVIEKVKKIAGDNLERAINMYFDGSWRDQSGASMQPFVIQNQSTIARRPSSQQKTSSLAKSPTQPTVSVQQHEIMPNQRYIGAFGVAAWATKSGNGLIKHEEKFSIERPKTKPPAKVGRGGKVIQARGRQHGDVIVRFINVKGEEIGRLPEDVAAWVSPLIDQNVCKFEGTCVYTPDKLRVNDTIYLQLRCYLLRKGFEEGSFKKPAEENRTTGIFEEKETTEEKSLRLRQVALVKLFDEINLQPSATNPTTAKHKRQGILEAAEISEQYENQNDKKKTEDAENGGSSPPSGEEPEEGKELEQDQLDTLYKKAQSFDFNTPVAEPADTFMMSLRTYQKQALHWMMGKEKDEKTEGKEISMHPLWEEYKWPIKDVDDKDLPDVLNQESFYVNPYSGELSLDFPLQEQHCLGGILADEMGLGKTIEMLSLMHSHRTPLASSISSHSLSVNNLPKLPRSSSRVEPAPYTTLVIAPMSLLAQWESEAIKASKPGTLKPMVYYGSDRAMNLQTLCREANAASAPNLIITSYGNVLSEFNQVAKNGGDRGSHGGLFSLDYFRIILDEGHFIKNRQSKTAKACYELNAQHRWVLTGTPIVNRLEDLFSLVRFLRVEPWSNFSFWKTFITMPFESKDFLRALDVVQTVLEPLVIRRTKDMKTPDGEPLVPLPPKTIKIEEIELSKTEQEVYDYIYMRAKRTFNATMEAGTLLKSYTTIFAQILRLRQACCHPVLTRNKAMVAEEEEAAAASDIANGLADDMDLQELVDRFTSESIEQDANKFGAHVLQQIQDEAENECPICSEEPMIDPAVTGCWHSACKNCLLNYIEHQTEKNPEDLPRCFNCREIINQRDIFSIIRHDDHLFNTTTTASSFATSDNLYDATPPGELKALSVTSKPLPRISLRRIDAHGSAKIAALVTHLKHLRRDLPGTKVVVFSQFTSFLDIIAPALTRENIPFLRFDGSMNQKTRASVLTSFANPDSSTSGYGTVLLLSLRAGGVGLNLTMAKRVYMMDPWWSFAVEAQAIDRVHRMGQDGEVKVVRFVVKGSIEGRMLKVQDRKKFIAQSLGMVSEEERRVQRIEDIKELLS
ncbi:DNA helicase rad5 [Agyrium rufum]|nr:DNA helicase rad5 [Agyrium rufum]